MNKVKNAIILAAGRGSRLKQLTDTTPKPLLAPRGITFVEGIISKLREKGIDEIYIVTGYLGDKFSYLKNDGIKIIRNDSWDKGNNVTSIQAAIDVIGDSLIVNGDIILEENVFQNQYEDSLTYVEENSNIDEWIVEIDRDSNVTKFDKNGLGKSGYYQKEIIFLTESLAQNIKNTIEGFDKDEYYEFLILETAKKYNKRFTIMNIDNGLVYDLDTVEEFNKYRNSKS